MTLVLYALALTVIWVLAWGSLSVANVVGGLGVAALLLVLAPETWPRWVRPRVRPVATVRFAAHVLVKVLESNVVLIREVLTRNSRIHTGVIAVPLPECSPGMLTLVANIMALTPGTMPVEVVAYPPVIYVHVLVLNDVEAARRDIQHLAALAFRAFGTVEAAATAEAMVARPGPDRSRP